MNSWNRHWLFQLSSNAIVVCTVLFCAIARTHNYYVIDLFLPIGIANNLRQKMTLIKQWKFTRLERRDILKSLLLKKYEDNLGTASWFGFGFKSLELQSCWIPFERVSSWRALFSSRVSESWSTETESHNPLVSYCYLPWMFYNWSVCSSYLDVEVGTGWARR